MTRTVLPWQVWWADFNPEAGREQAGQRPAVVVGSSFACELPNDLVFVVPCTTKDRGLPFHPRLDSLGQPGFAMCDQLKSISRGRLVRQHSARLEKPEIEAIRFVLRRMIEV
ncbi:MAG TPA: type II toxin-antitoxin system PemK/MazF family toxin [Amycolatopsis sp.]|nr:type II toxin-antitoxin system PemK/MazF family toxin [Amycolatopsis sp.]